MRVCVLGRGTSPHVSEWVEYWATLGHDVHLVTLDPVAIHGVRVHAIRSPHRSGIRYFAALWSVRRLLHELAPDAVVAYYVTGYGLLAALGGRDPIVLCTAGSDVRLCGSRRLHRLLVKFNLGRAALVQAPAPHVRDELIQLGIPCSRIVVLPRGIAVPDELRIERDATLTVSTRHLHPLYDVQTAIAAFDVIRQSMPDSRLCVVGDGPQRESLMAMAGSRLGDRCEFVGYQDRQSMWRRLSEANVYVSTSHEDGASVSLFEAMATGAYPVVTDIPANRVYIRHGENGLLFRPGDVSGLAAALEEAYRGGAGVEAARVSNRKIVSRLANRDSNLRILARCVEELIEGRPATQATCRGLGLGERVDQELT